MSRLNTKANVICVSIFKRITEHLIWRRTVISRRKLLSSASMLALIPVANLIPAIANAASNVDLKDPSAVALKYVENASDAQRADKMGTAAADQFCDNCRFYKVDSGNAARGGCALFKNNLVAGKGWCAAWVPTA